MSGPRRRPILASWSDVPATPLRPGLVQRGFGTDDVLLLLNQFDPAEVSAKPHSHADFDQLIVVLEGTADFRLDGVPYRATTGDVLLVPAGVEHATEPLAEGGTFRSLEVFVPMREDYRHLLGWMADAGLPAPATAEPPAG